MPGKVWSIGDRWAFITARGKRGIKKTKGAAQNAAGLGAGTRLKPSKKSKSRSRSTTTNKKKGKGGGRKILGTIGWKGALASIASLAVLRIAIRRMFGQVPAEYVDSASMVGAGIVGKATKIGTAHLLAPGVVLGVSKLIEDLVSPGGAYTYPGIGNGGYDF